MKNRVFTIYVSFALLLLSIVSALVCSSLKLEILLNFSYGIFGSSIVTLVIYFFEYQNERKTNFEKFYTSSITYLNGVKQIEFFDVSEKEISLIKYAIFKDNDALKNVKEDFYEEISRKISKIDHKPKMTKKELDYQSSIYLSLFKRSLQSYLLYMKSNFHDLGLLISDSKFLFWESKRKYKLYQREIYDKVMDSCKAINSAALPFKLFVENQPSRLSINEIIHNLEHLNSIFFEKRVEDGKNVVYSKFCDDLFDLVEKYRCSFYHKKYVQKKHFASFEELHD